MGNLYCYELGKEVARDLKATDQNMMCGGCRYFSFCERDVSGMNREKRSSGRKNSSRKSHVSKLVEESIGDQLSLFGDEVELLPNVELGYEGNDLMTDKLSGFGDVSKDELDLSLSGLRIDFGEVSGDANSTNPLSDGRGRVLNRGVKDVPKLGKLVVYDEWIDDSKVDSVSLFGIDVGGELPYFTDIELTKLGRYASSYWN